MPRALALVAVCAALSATSPSRAAHAVGLADPAAAKAADACQKALLQGGRAFAAATLKGLGACFDGTFKCVQTKPDDDACLPKAVAKCGKDGDARAKRLAKLATSVVKKCPALADVLAADGLGFTASTEACGDAGTPLTDVAGVAACVRERLECRAEAMLSVALPRARAFADTFGVALRAGSCLEDLGGAGRVSNPDTIGKPLDKCQREVRKAAATFVPKHMQSLEKCTAAVFACVQKKPADAKCLEKAGATCAKIFDAVIPVAEVKLSSTTSERCAAVFNDARPASGINVDALGPSCQAVGVATLATAEDWGRCVMRQHACTVEGLLRVMAPRADALLAEVGRTAASAFCGPPATPTIVPTPTVTATPQPGETATTTPEPTATATPSPTPTTTATPQPNVAFVSSTTVATDLGGVAAYDLRCNQLATAAGLNNGTNDAFVSWVSDSTSDAPTRLGAARGWVRVDGKVFADSIASLLAGGVLNPLLVDENGAVVSQAGVMTGTVPTGAVNIFGTCDDWTVTGVAGSVLVGRTDRGPQTWTSFVSVNCDPRRIYCLEKSRTAVLVPPPASGKKLFLSSTPFAPGSGDPDAVCEAAKPAGAGSVVALLATSSAAASTLLNPAATYVRPDGQLVGTGQQLIDTGKFPPADQLESGPWQSAIDYPDVIVWTGSSDMSATPTTADTCADWTSTTGTGRIGVTSTTLSSFWDAGTEACSSGAGRLYCIEQ